MPKSATAETVASMSPSFVMKAAPPTTMNPPMMAASKMNRGTAARKLEFARACDVRISRIGEIVAREDVRIVDVAGKTLPDTGGGWDHFDTENTENTENTTSGERP